MSFQAVTWAIEQRTGSPSAKSALWSIANYANDVWCAWPKQSTIADDSEQSTDSVGKRVADLVGVGYLRRIKLKRYGRRTHDFLILRPSPLFLAPLADILPHLPAGCDLMDDAAADSGSVEAQEQATAHNESEINAAADSGSVPDATLPQSAVDAAALVRQPHMEPIIKPDSLPQTPSQERGEGKGQPKEEVTADSAFETWFQKLNEVYPRPDTRPEQTRDEALRLSDLERDQCLHAASGVAEFARKNPKARDIVGLLKFVRSSALWAQYRRFAPTPDAVPPPRIWCEFGSDEWRARAVLYALIDRDMPAPKLDEKLQIKGADFLGHLPPAGLVLARYANSAGEINKLDWIILFTPDRRIGAPVHPNVEGDRGKVAAWRTRIQECLGANGVLKIKDHKIDPGLPTICGGVETITKWVPGVLVPADWPPNKGSLNAARPLATNDDLNEFGKAG